MMGFSFIKVLRQTNVLKQICHIRVNAQILFGYHWGNIR